MATTPLKANTTEQDFEHDSRQQAVGKTDKIEKTRAELDAAKEIHEPGYLNSREFTDKADEDRIKAAWEHLCSLDIFLQRAYGDHFQELENRIESCHPQTAERVALQKRLSTAEKALSKIQENQFKQRIETDPSTQKAKNPQGFFANLSRSSVLDQADSVMQYSSRDFSSRSPGN